MRGSSASRRPSPSRLTASTVTDRNAAGKEHDVGLDLPQRPALGHDVAPGRNGGRRAGADEGQNRLHDHGAGADIGGLHQHRRQRVGQDVAQDDHRRARAGGDGRVDIGLLAQRQHDAAHEARHARDFGDGDGEDDVADAAARQRHQRDGEQDRRDRHQPVHEPHDDAVGPAHETRDEADGETGERGEERHRQADGERDPRPVEHARIDVAAELVGAEPVSRRGRPRALGGRERGRVDGPEIRREYPDQDEAEQQRAADRDCRMVAQEAE